MGRLLLKMVGWFSVVMVVRCFGLFMFSVNRGVVMGSILCSIWNMLSCKVFCLLSG